jgi:hypothetical protein
MSDPATEAKIDAMLNVNSIRLISRTGAAQTPDAMMVVHFPDTGEGIMALAADRLDAIPYIDIPQTNNKELWTGKWCVLSNEIGFDAKYEKEARQGIVRTLKLGFHSTLGWNAGTKRFTDARILQYITNPITANSIVGVPAIPTDYNNSASDDPTAEVLYITFPNIDPSAAKACMASLAASYTEIVIKGESYGSITHPLHKLVVTSDVSENGAVVITAIYGSQQFTVKNFLNAGTIKASTQWVIYDVPKVIGQGLVEAWKGQSFPQRDGSVSNDEKTCTVTLSALDELIPQNFELTYPTLGGINYYRNQTNAEIGDALAAAVALPSDGENTASGSLNEFGKEDFSLSSHTKDVDFYLPHEFVNMILREEHERFSVRVYVIYTKSFSDAVDHCDDVPIDDFDIIPSIPGYQTGVNEMEKGYFRATRVEHALFPL